MLDSSLVMKGLIGRSLRYLRASLTDRTSFRTLIQRLRHPLRALFCVGPSIFSCPARFQIWVELLIILGLFLVTQMFAHPESVHRSDSCDSFVFY